MIACDGGMVRGMVRDHAWVGVMRMAPGQQLWPGRMPPHQALPSSTDSSLPRNSQRHLDRSREKFSLMGCDGFCPGFGDPEGGYDNLGRRIPAVNASLASGKHAPVNYGCWFYTAGNASRWSGAYVNVGRSLRVRSRCDVHALMYGSRSSANPLCTHNPGDKFWCVLARSHGFDSIQILRGTAKASFGKRKPWSELVLCTDECATMLHRNNACVSAARSLSANGTVLPCDCPSEAQVLSCDASSPAATYGLHRYAVLPLVIPGERAPARNAKLCEGPPFNLSRVLGRERLAAA